MMNQIRYTYHVLVLLLMVAGCAALLSGCKEEPKSKSAFYLIGGVETYSEMGVQIRLPAMVADGLADTYTAAAELQPIRVLLYDPSTQETASAQTGSGGKAYFETEKNHAYCMYGYMPASASTGSSVSNASATGGTLTLSGVSAIGSVDICVISGVKKYTSVSGGTLPTILTTTESTPDLGQFGYVASENDNMAYILMDHICTWLDFRFSVDATYAQLRQIKLKKMSIRPADGLSTGTATITLPASSVSFTPSTTEAETNFYIAYASEDAQGQLLPSMADVLSTDEAKKKDYHHVPLYTIGGLSNAGDATKLSLVLKTEYDVYDMAGNCIRENCTVTNTLAIDRTAHSLTPGMRYPIKLTITPTYLYVLSDPDLDNPSVTTTQPTTQP